jgi:hypothetical protein
LCVVHVCACECLIKESERACVQYVNCNYARVCDFLRAHVYTVSALAGFLTGWFMYHPAPPQATSGLP